MFRGYPQRPANFKVPEDTAGDETERWRIEAEARRFRLHPQKLEAYVHILEVRLVKPPDEHASLQLYAGTHVFALVRRLPMAATRGKPKVSDGHVLLSLATATEGTQLHALAACLSRAEPLSHVLAWAKAERFDFANTTNAAPYSAMPAAVAPLVADLVELPRLKLTLRTEQLPSGEWRVYSLDYASFYLVDAMQQAEASLPPAALVRGAPHALIFRSEHGEYQVVVPNILPVRPNIRNRPFSTELVFMRSDVSWRMRTSTRAFVFPVHVSGLFLEPGSLASALYLLVLRLIARDYEGAVALIGSITTDAKMTAEEKQIFKLLAPASSALLHSTAPDLHAIRQRIFIALKNAHIPMAWDVRFEQASYVHKLGHISARCRLSEADELNALLLVCEYDRNLKLVEQLMKRNPHDSRGALIAKATMTLRAKADPVYASEEELSAMIKWIEQHAWQPMGRRAEMPKDEQRRLDNRRMLLEALATEFETEDSELRLQVQAAEGCQSEDLVLRYSRSAAESLGTLSSRIVCEHVRTSVFDVAALASIVHEICHEFACGMEGNHRNDVKLSFLFLYEIFTGTKTIGFARNEPRHQHTFASLLCELYSDFHHNGLLQSICSILRRNPWACSVMPQFDASAGDVKNQMSFNMSAPGSSTLSLLLAKAVRVLHALNEAKYAPHAAVKALRAIRLPSAN